jgi:FkbM family methyltransferase
MRKLRGQRERSVTVPKNVKQVAPGRHSHGFIKDAWVVLRFVWNHPSNRGARPSAIARSLRFQVRGRLLGKPTIVPYGSTSKLEILPATGASALAYANPLELNEVNAWRRILTPGDLFVDAGANIGSFSVIAAEMGARILAIEPDPHAAATFRRNMELNGFEYELIEAAVADREGQAQFSIGKGVLNHILTDGDSGRHIRTITLDALLEEAFVSGLKLDVEGAELLALKGAQRALAEHRIAYLQLEWNPQSSVNFSAARDEIHALLSGFGYELCRPDESGQLHPLQSLEPGPDVFARLRS